MASLKNKVVLITGASSGIGAGIAIYLSKLGSKLAINSRDTEELQKVSEQCREQGLQEKDILLVPGNISNEDTAIKMVQKTAEYFGQIDVLINNAGILEWGYIQTTSLESFDRVLNVNLRSAFHLTKLCGDFLIKTKGNIVNISSVNGLHASADVVAYSISKAGLDQLTKCAAQEFSKHGVRVNAVNPGIIETNLHKRSGIVGEELEKLMEHNKTTSCLGRNGEVEEVAKTVAFLASDDASYITGVLLPVDGGRLIKGN